MSGDWIKMRTDLWDDPRVAALCDKLGSTEAVVSGGLYRLWTIADQHSVDGLLVAMTPALLLALVILSLQIVLGGWVSTNYAALACTDLPTCQGQWWPPSNFTDAFHVIRDLGKTGQGAPIDAKALTAIHLSHRVGAVVAAGYLLWLGAKASQVIELAWLGRALIVLVVIQVLLGLSNVWFSLPLAVAVSHNGVAALLVAVLVMLNFRAFAARKQI